MTDNEIKKALECCSTNGASCKDCPAFLKVDRSKCKQVLLGASDMISRLQTKNENLKSDVERLQKQTEKYPIKVLVGYNSEIHSKSMEDYENLIADIANEGVKEFAQKVIKKVEKSKQKYQRLCKEQGDKEDEAMNIHFRGMINIVKEIAGENND